MVAFVLFCLWVAILGRFALKMSARMDFLSKRRLTTHWCDTVFAACMILGSCGVIGWVVSLAWEYLP